MKKAQLKKELKNYLKDQPEAEDLINQILSRPYMQSDEGRKAFFDEWKDSRPSEKKEEAKSSK